MRNEMEHCMTEQMSRVWLRVHPTCHTRTSCSLLLVAKSPYSTENTTLFKLCNTKAGDRVWYTMVCMPKRKETRTYKDRAAYLAAAVSKRRRKLREMAVDYGGGQCKICGYNKCARALSFHHRDPEQKDFGISAGGLTRSWEKIQNELDKCILVCANCHMEIHEGLINISKK